MIAGIFHSGSGLGNQLHRYVMTRVLALDKGYEWTMIAQDLFKGKDFMNLDMGKNSHIRYRVEEPSGKVIPTQFIEHFNPNFGLPPLHSYESWGEWNKNVYDPDINFVEDDTVIDGNFEDDKYFGHRMKEIDEWLKVKPLYPPDDLCLIGFRGGEYYAIPELGLPKEYFDRGIKKMREINPRMRFEVHTDDVELAKEFFPKYEIIRDVEINWRSMRYAKYAIIANSSFYVLPRLLSEGVTIAPKYWNRYNTKKWDYPQSYYKSFKYI